MNIEVEKQLVKLARELWQLDKRIIESITKGDRPSDIETEFRTKRDEAKALLTDSAPVNIRDPEARKSLRWIRSGDHFHVDKEDKKVADFVKNNPEKVEELIRLSGIKLDGDVAKEAEKDALEQHWKLIEELTTMISAEKYFERRDKFSTIIVANSLPAKISQYFVEIRECFVLGQMYAAVGLCRVLIELSFRDKHQKFGPGKKSDTPNLHNMADHRLADVIRMVSSKMGVPGLKQEAQQLYGTASDILHGREARIRLNDSEVIEFVRKVFAVVERLY